MLEPGSAVPVSGTEAAVAMLTYCGGAKPGAPGAKVSFVATRVATGETLEPSVACACAVSGPSSSAERSNVVVKPPPEGVSCLCVVSWAAASVTQTSTSVKLPATVPLTGAALALDPLTVGKVSTGVPGATVSLGSEVVCVVVLPAASTATTVMVTVPSGTPAVSTTALYWPVSLSATVVTGAVAVPAPLLALTETP